MTNSNPQANRPLLDAPRPMIVSFVANPDPSVGGNILRVSYATSPDPNVGSTGDDEYLLRTPVLWNYGPARAGRKDCQLNPDSMTNEEFTRQHGPHPGQVVTWHDKRVPTDARPPLTLWQWLMPWTRPKLSAHEKWARKQLD